MERHGYKNGYGAYECRSLDSFMWRGYLDLPSTGHLFWWLTRTLSIGTKKRIKLWIVECCLQQLWYSRLWNNRNRKLSIWGKKVSCQLLNFLNLAVYKHNYLQSEENSTRIESQNFTKFQLTSRNILLALVDFDLAALKCLKKDILQMPSIFFYSQIEGIMNNNFVER